MTRGSLESRLLWRLALSVGAALSIAGFLLVGLVEVRARADFDRLLGDRARALASLSEQEDGQIWLEFDPAAYPEFLPGTSAEYFEFRDDSGKAISRSPSAAGQRIGVGPASPGARAATFVDLALPDGRAGRAVVLRFAPRVEHPDEEDGVGDVTGPPAETDFKIRRSAEAEAVAPREAEIVVARERGSLEAFLRRVRSSAAIAFTSLLVGVVLLIGWTLRRELLRVRTLADRIQAVDAASLGRPLGQISLPTELRPLALRIEELLSRLHEAFEREREFSRQLAHELRTPLAEMRTAIDVALRWPESQDSLVETLREVEGVGAQMESLLANLLVLARADAGIEGLRADELRLGEELDRVAGDLSARLGERSISVRNRIAVEASVVMPEAVLSLMLRNVVANAADHADPSTWVEVSFDPDGGRLTFRNPTSDLVAEDLPNLFERFWRKRADRLLGDRVGLGLPLVRKLARDIGGDATAQLEGGVLSITIEGLRVSPAPAGTAGVPIE